MRIATLLLLLAALLPPGGAHLMGTDKTGQDVLFMTLKSVRTGLIVRYSAETVN